MPAEGRDERYNQMRLKNTESSRRSRQRKRQIDEERVALIKTLQEENESLKEQVKHLTIVNQTQKEIIEGRWGPEGKP